MGHWKACPGCGQDTEKCAYEDVGVGKDPCYRCEGGFWAGYERAFVQMWAHAVRFVAAQWEREAARRERLGGPRAHLIAQDVTRIRAEAAQLRAWADEGEA